MEDKEFYPYWLQVLEVGSPLLPNDVKRKIYKPKRKVLNFDLLKKAV
jgi:hypothetical protein